MDVGFARSTEQSESAVRMMRSGKKEYRAIEQLLVMKSDILLLVVQMMPGDQSSDHSVTSLTIIASGVSRNERTHLQDYDGSR